jgi:tetratricopeptide (TPR) repeat protein
MSTQRLEQLLDMLNDSPDDAFLRFALAMEYDKLGQYSESLGAFLKLRETHPDYVGLYYHLGKWFERNGNLEGAVMSYKEGIDVAKRQGDRHALGELRAAYAALEEEE